MFDGSRLYWQNHQQHQFHANNNNNNNTNQLPPLNPVNYCTKYNIREQKILIPWMIYRNLVFLFIDRTFNKYANYSWWLEHDRSPARTARRRSLCAPCTRSRKHIPSIPNNAECIIKREVFKGKARCEHVCSYITI